MDKLYVHLKLCVKFFLNLFISILGINNIYYLHPENPHYHLFIIFNFPYNPWLSKHLKIRESKASIPKSCVNQWHFGHRQQRHSQWQANKGKSRKNTRKYQPKPNCLIFPLFPLTGIFAHFCIFFPFLFLCIFKTRASAGAGAADAR